MPDLTKYASHVYVLVRRNELRASKIMQKRLQNNPKIVRAFNSKPLFFTCSNKTLADNLMEYCRNKM